MTGLATLGMYDFPEIRAATDGWWRTIARALRAEGVSGVPEELDRSRPAATLWRDPALLIAQTCGYPLTHGFSDALTAVAVPSYAAEGCGPGRYRSAFLVRADDSAVTLADLRDRRAAANEAESHSGCNALRAAVAPLAREGRFFASVLWTGAHRASIAAVRSAASDIAAVDAATLALLRRHAPEEIEGLRVLGWSAEAPALPYATRRGTESGLRSRIIAALTRAAADPDAAEAREKLLITGLSPVDDAAYAPIPTMRRKAERLGYPELA